MRIRVHPFALRSGVALMFLLLVLYSAFATSRVPNVRPNLQNVTELIRTAYLGTLLLGFEVLHIFGPGKARLTSGDGRRRVNPISAACGYM